MERRALLDDRLHRREACDRAGGQRPDRPGRDGVDADVLLAQVPREVLHRGVERGLGDAHHVVVRHRALAAEVRHRQDRAAAARLHQRLGQARAGDEGVSRDVERQPETVARRVGEAALKILGGGERDRVHEQVEATVEPLANLAEDALEVPVGADIALGDERRAHGLGELANVLLDPLSLVGEGELGTSLREPARDRPRDRAAVCDAENQAALARECPFHGRESMAEFSATLRLLRRSLVLVCSAALVLATAATAQLKPIRLPHKADRTLPRVRDGVIRIPTGHASGRVTVLVDLRLPPLAAARGQGLLAFSAQRKLSTTSRSSRAYLARLARLQAQPAAQIRHAIPAARIQERYRIVLDGFALRIPYRDLSALGRVPAVRRIYPTLGYRLDTNKSPSVIHADQFWANTGGLGDGVKIGVVDDGIDAANPFFNPAGFSYPAGFPKGQRKFTTPKVIVARAFPGPGSGKQGRLPLYRADSFHGTHVCGIAEGVQGTVAFGGPDHPQVTGLSGIAPRAWLGNYRVFNTPVPTGGDDAFTPQI